MMKIGIIGTAGRKDDGARLSREMYFKMLKHLNSILPQGRIRAISGGAAWADHLAISLFLRKRAEVLELHLPAKFINSKYVVVTERDPGDIANYYHGLFSTKMGGNTLGAVQQAIDLGATIKTHKGFFRRNLYVGDVDILIAYTYGRSSGSYQDQDPGWNSSSAAGLKDGGTAHTWNHSKASKKIHKSLYEL